MPRVASFVLFVAAGAFSFAAQALLLRECLVLYRGSELALGFFFASWLGWIAVGARLGRMVTRDPRRAARCFAPLALAYAAAPLVQLLALAGARWASGVPAWQLPPLGRMLGLTMLANAPVSLLTGLLFTVAAVVCAPPDAADERGASRAAWVTRAYLWEVLGSVVGGLTLTLLLWRGAPSLTLLVGVVLAWYAALALFALLGARRRLAVVASVLCAGAALQLCCGAAGLEIAMQRWRLRAAVPSARLLAARETPYQHIAVARLGEQTIVLRNGALAESYPDEPGHARSAALTMLQRPGARRVLAFGSLATGLARHLLGHAPELLHWIDGDPVATGFLRPHLAAADRQALGDPRLRTSAGDPRARLAALPVTARYDLIAVLTPEPESALGNRLFTREVYQALARQLAPGGVLVTRVPGTANTRAGETLGVDASVYRTLRSVFPRVVATPGEMRWLFAGGTEASPTADSGELARRLRRSGVATPGLAAAALARSWSVERVQRLAEQLGRVDARENSDAQPVAYFYGLLERTRQTDATLERWLTALRRAGLGSWLWPLLLLVLLRLHQVAGRGARGAQGSARRFNARLALVVLGAASMALYLLLLLAFQSRQGAVFEQVGLVGALYMLGLALGGQSTLRLARLLPQVFALALAAFAALLAVLPALVAVAVPGSRAGLFFFYALFLLGGGLGGALLPWITAELAAVEGATGDLAGQLESGDHLGGAVAALLGGTLIVPLVGLSGARWLLLAAIGAVLVLLLLEQRRAAPARTRLERWLETRAAQRSFPFPRLSYALAAIVLVCFAVAATLRVGLDPWQRRFGSDELARLVDGQRFVERREPFAHYLIDAPPADGKQDPRRARAACVASISVAPDVRGYGGPLNVLVELDARQRLGTVLLLQSRETPQYLRGIERWLAALRGRSAAGPLRPRLPTDEAPADEHSVDVLSGATITARAVLRAVDEGSAALDRAVYGRSRAAGSELSLALLTTLREPAVLYLLLAFVLALLVARFAGPVPRLAFLALNVLVGGLLLNVQLSTVDLRRLLSWELPGVAHPSLALLFLLVALSVLLLGPLYCSALCPLGAAQELLASLGFVQSGTPPPALDRARYLKYLLLALTSVLFLAGNTAPEAADPLTLNLGLAAGGRVVALLLLLGIALGAVAFFRPFCRYLCPVGALLHLGNKVRLLGRFFWRQRRYDRCDLGVRGQRDVDCLQCDRCVHATARQPTAERSLLLGRDRLLAGWLCVLLLLLAVLAWQGSGSSPSREHAGRGRPRKVDVPELRRRIESGRLSNHPARWAEPWPSTRPAARRRALPPVPGPGPQR